MTARNQIIQHLTLHRPKFMPPVLFLLRHMYGVSTVELCRITGRSRSMMSYYLDGTTPPPPQVMTQLHSLLKEARGLALEESRRHPTRLLDAVIRATDEVIDQM